MILSKYQKAAKEAFIETNDNLCIEAGPGCSKTTTLVELSKHIPRYKKAIFLAFNKSIVEELKTKLPTHVDCSTLHSYGYRTLYNHIGGSLKLDQYKTIKLSKSVLESLKLPRKKDIAYKLTIQSILDFYRITGKSFEEVVRDYDIICKNGELKHTPQVWSELVNYNKKRHKKMMIDFVDMLYLPLSLNVKFPQYEIVMVDECFPNDQNIATNIGKKKIGSLVRNFLNGKEVPKVLSYNEYTGNFEYKKITNAWERDEKELIQITVGGKRKIKCTPNHLLYSDDGWKKASDFVIGDVLISNTNIQPYSSIPNDDQFQIFLASKIGDGSIGKMYNNLYRCSFIHGEPQRDYLYWKAKMFNQVDNVRRVEENGYSKKPAYTFNTRNYYIRDEYYEGYNFIDNLDLRGLSILFMDDGAYQSNRYTLYSFAYDKDGVKYLCEYINKYFDISGKVSSHFSSTSGNEYWYIMFNTVDSYKISSELSPLFHHVFKYKIHDHHIKYVGLYDWEINTSSIGCMIVSNISYLDKKEKVYDIEVEDNHNFIITSHSRHKGKKEGSMGGFIAHNCQDLSDIQHKLLSKIKKPNGRIIGVGDGFQSIYSFAGSASNSMELFKQKFKTTNLPLSISYRLPKTGVTNVHNINDKLEYHQNAIDGVIRDGFIEEIQEKDFVICRNTKPLVALYFELLKQEKKATIMGKDMEKGLLKLINALEIESMTKKEAIFALNQEKQYIYDILKGEGIENPFKHYKYITFAEKSDIIQLFLEKYESTTLVKQKLHEVFDENRPGVKLMTGHRSKGLENDTVFFITHYDNKKLIPSEYAQTEEQLLQERNLEYVIKTRHKKQLIYVKL